jgi:DUF4097 and DUF4098 domain-containing protein YvlB
MGAMSTEATMHTFSTPNPVQLRVELWQGRLSVEATETDTTTVELRPLHGNSSAQDLIDTAKVEQRGDEIVVLMPRVKSGLFRSKGEIEALIRVPTNSSAKLESGSADIETTGRLSDVSVTCGSGNVSVEYAADARIKSGSGDITVDTVSGSCNVKTGSADVRIGTVGRSADIIAGSGDVVIDTVSEVLKVKTGSGDLVLQEAGDSVDAMAGSGDLLVKRIDHGQVKVKTGSGDISIGVARGTAAYLDIMTVTGDVKSDLDPSDSPGGNDLTAEINVQSGSGDVVLQHA